MADNESPVLTRVIAIGNQKGGVGKTTNTAHLGAALGEMGRSVLCWDLDVNYGLTSHFGIPQHAYSGTLQVLTGDREPEDVILTSDDPDIELPEGVHVIPSSRELEQLNKILAAQDAFFTPHTVLLDPVAKLRGLYDYILLDTAPNTSLATTTSAYLAADYFVISTLPEKLAIEGMKNALKDLKMAQRPDLNPKLELLGLIVSGLDRRIRRAREYNSIIEESFTGNDKGSRKFRTTISRAAAVSRAQDRGQTIFEMEPNHKVAEQFRDIAREMEERIVQFESKAGDFQEAVGNG